MRFNFHRVSHKLYMFTNAVEHTSLYHYCNLSPSHRQLNSSENTAQKTYQAGCDAGFNILFICSHTMSTKTVPRLSNISPEHSVGHDLIKATSCTSNKMDQNLLSHTQIMAHSAAPKLSSICTPSHAFPPLRQSLPNRTQNIWLRPSTARTA